MLSSKTEILSENIGKPSAKRFIVDKWNLWNCSMFKALGTENICPIFRSKFNSKKNDKEGNDWWTFDFKCLYYMESTNNLWLAE